ncbi:hypothetical protein D3C72_2497060 [compost metagenome]
MEILRVWDGGTQTLACRFQDGPTQGMLRPLLGYGRQKEQILFCTGFSGSRQNAGQLGLA